MYILHAFWDLESLCSELHISVSTFWLSSLCIVRTGVRRQRGRRPQETKQQDPDSVTNTARSTELKFSRSNSLSCFVVTPRLSRCRGIHLSAILSLTILILLSQNIRGRLRWEIVV